jgi:DNA-directed RNA polymerase subunit RPC12/RpoP
MSASRELGYLMVDNRLSGGKLFESSTYTCTHCNAVVVMNLDRKRERAKCHACRHQICDNCAAVYSKTHECLNLARRIDKQFEIVTHSRQSETPLLLLP